MSIKIESLKIAKGLYGKTISQDVFNKYIIIKEWCNDDPENKIECLKFAIEDNPEEKDVFALLSIAKGIYDLIEEAPYSASDKNIIKKTLTEMGEKVFTAP